MQHTEEERSAHDRKMRRRQIAMIEELPDDQWRLIKNLEEGVRYVFGGNAIFATQTEERGQFKYSFGVVIGSTIMGADHASLNPEAFSKEAIKTIKEWETEADDEKQVQLIRAE